MTYVIEGKLKVMQKPAKYLNKYIDHRFTESRYDALSRMHMRGESFSATPHKSIANWLNKRGQYMVWLDNPEIARSLCTKAEIGIDQTKFSTPGSWKYYLTNQFTETDEWKTLDGKLNVWRETRLPLPWFYVVAYGKLENQYVFDNGFKIVHSGTEESKFAIGVKLDIPILNGIGFTYEKMKY